MICFTKSIQTVIHETKMQIKLRNYIGWTCVMLIYISQKHSVKKVL